MVKLKHIIKTDSFPLEKDGEEEVCYEKERLDLQDPFNDDGSRLSCLLRETNLCRNFCIGSMYRTICRFRK